MILLTYLGLPPLAAFTGKDVGTIIASIYHMVTGTSILDAQNSRHGDHNSRDGTGRQQKNQQYSP
jgi:hypothetical protein